MPSLFPSPHKVCHVPRSYAAETLDPDTGNPILMTATPVVRRAQEITQMSKASSKDVMSGEFVDRVETTLHMSVDDVGVYSSQDQVIVDAQFDGNGDYVPGTGEAYFVDGNPNDQRGGPWPSLFKVFGGIIILKRVT
jgi:hypothetical protein